MDDDSPEITEVRGSDLSVPLPDDEEDEEVCRICRSPEEPENPLRYPCLCRGSMKYVHQDCLHRWLIRSRYKKCEVCGRSYSFVPVYSETAPERLPCYEFLFGVISIVVRFMNPIVSWILVILFNVYCSSLHPWGQELTAEFQDDIWRMSREFAYLLTGLFYNFFIACFFTIFTAIRVVVGELNARRILDGFRVENFIGNGILQRFIGGVWQVLWIYIKILCDWHFHKLNYFLEQPGPPGPPILVLLVPPNPPLHEFGVIRRLFFFLHDDAFVFLAISVCGPILLVLLPFWIGWIVLATDGGSYLSGYSPFMLGYIMMVLVPFAYFGILFTVHQTSLPEIVQWFLQGLRFITVKLPCLLWVFLVRACKSLQRLGFGNLYTLIQTSFPAIVQWSSLVFHFIKDALVFCFKIGIQPCMIGWWLEICTSPLFGTTISLRFEFLSFPTMIYLRWMFGLVCLFIADFYMGCIQEIIHKRAFWYLLDITDPDYHITKLNLGNTLFALASHGVLLVILIHLPLKAITLISPSFFPLKFGVFGIPVKQSFICGIISFGLVFYSPAGLIIPTKAVIRLIVHNWIICVSSWLQLSDILLVVPRGEDQNPWFLCWSIAEGSLVVLQESDNAEDDDTVDTNDQKDDRIALMLVLAALSLFLISTAFIALPFLTGRIFYNVIMLRVGFVHDDVCAFWIGCYIWLAICIAILFVFDHIWSGRTDLLLKYALTWIPKALLFSIWILVIPGLLGVLIELMIIIPSRVPLDESPVYLLIQDWLIGVVLLHLWTFLTMLKPLSHLSTKTWQGKLERIKNDGINRLPSMWLLREVIGSIINTLLTTLCFTYLLVKALFPLLGFSQNVNFAVGRFTWPALLALVTVWFMTKLTSDLISYLHRMLFNERYQVGERIGDLTEDP